jgi:(p)ppGpp synthase/HD superfamily hydrolase
MTTSASNLVLRAMRLAEFAHRTLHLKGQPHLRKAPEGVDRPPYFIHLAEVGWMLQEARCAPATVAAGFLHDTIEDIGWTERELAKRIGSKQVARLVAWVSETEKDETDPGNWEYRNANYLERIRRAPVSAKAISCADKTSNMLDMIRLMQEGHPIDSYTRRPFPVQREKFVKLGAVFKGAVPKGLMRRFRSALREFEAAGRSQMKNLNDPKNPL